MIKALKDLCVAERSICYGIVQPGREFEGGKPILRVKNLAGDRIDHGDVMRVNPSIEAKYRRSRIKEGDVLVSLVGSLGQVAIAGPEVEGWNIARAVGLIPVIDRHHAAWVRYSLQSEEAQAFIRDHANTTVQATFNLRDLARIPIPYPSRTTREGILATLGALDDKIEVNRRMAATLEEMARALYRSWFVDFDPVTARAQGRAPAHMDAATAALFPTRLTDDGLPEGWEMGSLADIAHLTPEKWSKKNAPVAVEYVDLANTKWGVIETTTPYTWEDCPSRARLVLRPGDTIVGTVRPGNGSFAIVGRDGLTGSTGFAVLRPKVREARELVYLAATEPANIERLANLADGGAYPAVRPEVVMSTLVALCDASLLSAFHAEVAPLIDRIETSKVENRTLAALRDTLLPKLMSGELRVREAEAQVAEAV